MIALRTIDIRNDFKRVTEIIKSGEKVLIARPHNENLVVLSESDYNSLEKARNNAEYMAKIDESMEQAADGRIIVKTMDELEEMAK